MAWNDILLKHTSKAPVLRWTLQPDGCYDRGSTFWLSIVLLTGLLPKWSEYSSPFAMLMSCKRFHRVAKKNDMGLLVGLHVDFTSKSGFRWAVELSSLRKTIVHLYRGMCHRSSAIDVERADEHAANTAAHIHPIG